MERSKRVEVYPGRDGYYRFRLIAGNGEKLAASQPYRVHRPDGKVDPAKSKWNAKRGARTAHPCVDVVEV